MIPIKQKLITVKAGLGVLSYITARRSCVVKSDEDFRSRRHFFTIRGWFVEREEFTAITENGLLEFSKCPMELDQFAEQI